jgi:alkylhydroperoxidase family enzyme
MNMSSLLAQLSEPEIRDPELRAVLRLAAEQSAPKPEWYLTVGHNPEVAVAFARFWEPLHRGGEVEHTIKELCRIAIATQLGCGFCSEQRSGLATQQGMVEEDVLACSTIDYDPEDARTRAALHLARAVALGDVAPPELIAEVQSVFTPSEIVELTHFFALTTGFVGLAKVLGLHLDAEVQTATA